MRLQGVIGDPCAVPAQGVIVELDPSIPSIGYIISDSDTSATGSSCFAVASLVISKGDTIPHFDPSVCNLALDAIPPGATSPGGPPCLEKGDDAYSQGFPDMHDHNPCPQQLCCQLPTGCVICTTEQVCHQIGGFPVTSLCKEQGNIFCEKPIEVEPDTWGRVKSKYTDVH
jgi:hypothetical protein